jgi:hypothetical protein
MEKFVNCFKHKCNTNAGTVSCERICKDKEKTQLTFLDEIRQDDREEIAIEILKWGQKYYRGKIFSEPNKSKQQIKEERTRDIKVLKKAQAIIEKFLPKEIGKTNFSENTRITTYEPCPVMNLFLLEDTKDKLEKIRLDIEKSEYQIIPREYYRGSIESPKEELKVILKSIIEKYNLKGKEEVNKFIVWLPNPQFSY